MMTGFESSMERSVRAALAAVILLGGVLYAAAASGQSPGPSAGRNHGPAGARGGRVAPAVPDLAVNVLHAPVFVVEASSESEAVVDLGQAGVNPADPALANLRLLDGRGVRVAGRDTLRKACVRRCGSPEEEPPSVCHAVGDYHYAGLPLERFTLAFPVSVDIRPHHLARVAMPRSAQVTTVAHVFARQYRVAENEYAASWVRGPKPGEWIEQATTWHEDPSGRPKRVVTATGMRLADCAVSAFGAITEFDCSNRRTVYVGNRYLGMIDEFELGPAVRYSADVNGTPVFVVLIAKDGVTRPAIVLRAHNQWSMFTMDAQHGAC